MLSRSKLQPGLESNSAAIYQSNSLPDETFLSSRLGSIFGNWEKRRVFWIENGAEYRTQVIGSKGPVQFGSRLGSTFCLSRSGFKLFAMVVSR